MAWLMTMGYIAMVTLSTWTLTEAAFEVARARYSTCAVNEGQGVQCWGENKYGQLGLGYANEEVTKPTDFVDFGTGFEPKDVGCGEQDCCCVSTVGTMKCWGRGDESSLGYGDKRHRGDESGEMGDDLPLVQLPTGFVADYVKLFGKSPCVVSTEGEIVCYGANSGGRLGVGHSSAVGWSIDDMGDNLVAVDLGEDFKLAHLGGGASSPCAVSTEGALKCWGANGSGQLGQGDTKNRGDNANEMGDYLKAVDLGTGFKATKASCADTHCCVVSTEGALKCMGSGSDGRSGYEDTQKRGDGAGELGDNLPVVNLGDGYVVRDVAVVLDATCTISTAGEVKCFGNNNYGQLGYGDKTDRGGTAGSMGNNLPVVAIGSAFTETGIRFAEAGTSGHDWRHFCVFEDSPGLPVQCWGYNNDGQLGVGSTGSRGDGANEMGDNLPYVAHDFTYISPCDADAMYPVIWHDMLNEDEQDSVLLHDHSVDFNASTLSLTLGATVEYVGLSADGNFDDSFNLGSTYWIDFQSFGALESSDGLDAAGTCANRRSDDYKELDFDDYFGFTTDPEDLESAPAADRMAYPPSSWTLTASGCNVVEYERTFSWTELTGCADKDGNALVSVKETNDSILLEGTFFMELLSPYSMSSPAYYRTYPLIQQDFAIKLMRAINVLSSTNTQLFISSVIAWGRSDEDKYEMTVLIQSVDYLQMSMDNVEQITAPNGLTVSGIEAVTSGCLVASSFTCGQIFTVTIDASCPVPTGCDAASFTASGCTGGPDCMLDNGRYTGSCCTTEFPCVEGEGDCDSDNDCAGSLVCGENNCGGPFQDTHDCCTSADEGTDDSDNSNVIDLGGNYQFAFTPLCRSGDQDKVDKCETFKDTLDETGKVVLDVDAYFVDSCDVDLFKVLFEAEMEFYLDDAFTQKVVDGESDPFVIGQDTIYGKVAVSTDVVLSFVEVEVEAVYVCTADDDADLRVNASTGLGGCLSSYIDDDGPYKVIGSEAADVYEGSTNYSVAANEAAFSFLTFNTARETVHVHVQLLLTVQDESGTRRRMRRMLLQSDDGSEGNAFKSYMGSASVQRDDTTNAPLLETDGAAAYSVGFMPAMFALIGWLMMG